MDIDINKMFKEKNKEIFRNSLTLELERNLNTLKNTTDNCVSLEINKLFLFFKSFFQENNIDFKKEELLGLLYREKNEINDIVNSEIENKKNNIISKYFDNCFKEETITDQFIIDYYNELQNETKIIINNIELFLNEEICTNFSLDITKKYKMNDINQLDRINSRVNVLFKDNVISRIKDQIVFRDDSLRNLAKESYNKYLNINNKTVEN